MPTLGAVKTLDRRSDLRRDERWLNERRDDPASRFLVFVDLNIVITSSPDRASAHVRWFGASELLAIGVDVSIVSAASLLGIDAEKRAHFAVSLESADLARSPGLSALLKPAVDLRSLARQGALDAEDMSVAGLARGLAAWQCSTRHCSACGGRLKLREAGWRQRCWACGRDHFPRMDPVVIMLVSDGERCLLGRDSRFPDNLYSCLAGFLEPGEDVAAAVRREVFEEAGLEIGEVTYQESQPWPFPHSLMIGCRARALTTDLTLDPVELPDAFWASREDVRIMLAGVHPQGRQAPGPYAIARKLLEAWLVG